MLGVWMGLSTLSPFPLTAIPIIFGNGWILKIKNNDGELWWASQDLNLKPTGYEPVVLINPISLIIIVRNAINRKFGS